jgi:hypothetical protein
VVLIPCRLLSGHSDFGRIRCLHFHGEISFYLHTLNKVKFLMRPMVEAPSYSYVLWNIFIKILFKNECRH